MSGVNISICDGKYTVIQAPTGTTRVLRYGEEWRDVTGDNVIGGLAWELQEARDRIKRLEEAKKTIDDLKLRVKRDFETILKFKAENEWLIKKIEQLYEGAEQQKRTIKRLEEAGDYLCAAAAFMGWHDKIETWNKAKEAKP